MPHVCKTETTIGVHTPSNNIELSDRIKRGPYQPILENYPRTKMSNIQRQFHKEWFKSFSWLEYSVKLDRAYCFSCRVFLHSNGKNNGQLDKTFSHLGFNNWRLGTNKFRTHQLSMSHINSTTSMSYFLNCKSIDVLIDKSNEIQLAQKEKQKLHNRQIMYRLIDVTLCLGLGGRPFRGHIEKSSELHQGLFLELVNLLKKYDPVLRDHLDNGPRNALYTRKFLLNFVEKKFQSSRTKLVMLVTMSKCLLLPIRYYSSEKKRPVERFFCLRRLLHGDAQTIFSELCDVLNNIGIEWHNVLSVCFDSASTMSGHAAGVQEMNSKRFYVHCYGHCLNLVLVDSIGKENRSCVRHAKLEKISTSMNIKLKTLKTLSTTRWACRSEAIEAIKHNYEAILKALEEISDSTNLPDVRAKTKGLIYSLKTFKFIFAMYMLSPILNLVNKVSATLQSPNLDLHTAVTLITALQNSLQTMRSDNTFNTIFDETKMACTKIDVSIPEVKRRKVSTKVDSEHHSQHFFENTKDEMKITVYNSVIDKMLNGIKVRFSQDTLNLIDSVGNLLKLEIEKEHIQTISDTFSLSFDQLDSEVRLFTQIDDIPRGSNNSTITQWLSWITKDGTDRMRTFENIYKVLQEFTTIPVTSCSCERAFSKMAIVKNKLRSTMAQQRLDALLTIFIEQEIVNSLDMEEIIDEFKTLTPIQRRLPL
ncbi:zinc finger MYM-type protein 1-like [Metopolophium dirhodum]|uniref:zinc finger MYM-type protein 1-like n=1 Tax=Metopolophium dirhodum TaxID=44670 RepID=UPI0029906026|nr:zinc finger MYM-type protein 1-like [Metopolophium dirhodum]